jgi:hypothetical protein
MWYYIILDINTCNTFIFKYLDDRLYSKIFWIFLQIYSLSYNTFQKGYLAKYQKKTILYNITSDIPCHTSCFSHFQKTLKVVPGLISRTGVRETVAVIGLKQHHKACQSPLCHLNNNEHEWCWKASRLCY